MRKKIARKLKVPKLKWRLKGWKRSAKKETKSNNKSKKLIDKRHQKLNRQKNFSLSLAIILILWILLGSYIYLIDPETKGALLIFFILLTSTLIFTLSFIFINTRRGILVTVTIIIFLLFRYFGLGNTLNAFLLGALAVIVDQYTKK